MKMHISYKFIDIEKTQRISTLRKKKTLLKNIQNIFLFKLY